MKISRISIGAMSVIIVLSVSLSGCNRDYIPEPSDQAMSGPAMIDGVYRLPPGYYYGARSYPVYPQTKRAKRSAHKRRAKHKPKSKRYHASRSAQVSGPTSQGSMIQGTPSQSSSLNAEGLLDAPLGGSSSGGKAPLSDVQPHQSTGGTTIVPIGRN